ncbi:DUF6197 family protein [Streptomyces celluloflavus]
MPAPVLTPAALDRAAGRAVIPVAEAEAWAGVTAGWERTAPADSAARRLLTATVDELVAEALRRVPVHGTRPAVEVRLPGRLARILPDWAHRTRTDLSHRPSTQLTVAAEILRRWGWQQKPHRLRDLRGRRCVCGAICTAVDGLGVGTAETAHEAARYILMELRRRGWPGLIGDWNQVPGRGAEEAIQLVETAAANAAAAGR